MEIFFTPLDLAEAQGVRELQDVIANLKLGVPEGELHIVQTADDQPLKFILRLQGLPNAAITVPKAWLYEDSNEAEIRRRFTDLFSMALPKQTK